MPRQPYTEEQSKFAFENKFTTEPNTGCWLWTARCFPFGYGQFKYKRKNITAHRMSWLLYKGKIPKGMCVLHKCDVPQCLNPDHLWLGTKADNNIDCTKKGRKFNQQKTHCKYGHSFSEDSYTNLSGVRICRPCRRARFRIWRQEKKLQRRK